MPSDKVSYLAAHYLSTDTKTSSKKRKRKQGAATSGLLIQDDDEPGWSTTTRNPDGDDADGPTLVAGTSAEFRRAKKNAWKTLTSTSKEDDTAAAAADAIIASAAAEQAAAAREADGEDVNDPGPVAPAAPMMSNGTQAGLQSAAAITAQLRIRQQAEREELERLKAERADAERRGEAPEGEGEVVLRDATGRRVDAAMRRAEMRKAAAEAEKAEEMRKRALKGEVQLEEARRRREALEDAALMPLARTKDDEEMNAEMKAASRWNDPMAQFLSNEGGDDGRGGRRKGLKGRRPVYKGPAAPNRYGIRPGYRWDGVDRGNGFEAERFKAINRKERVKGLEYAWQMDE